MLTLSDEDKSKFIESIRNCISDVTDLPTLPSIAVEVRKIIADSSSNISDLERVLEADIALTGRILRIANSAYYGIPRKVGNLKMAMVILGVREIVNLVTSVSVHKMIKEQHSTDKFNITDFFIHSANCAELTVGLFRALKVDSPSSAYISGLLHDVGKMVLNQYFPEYLEACLEYSREQKIRYIEAEIKILGIDHGHIGGWLGKRWNIPEDIMSAISQHHIRPSDMPKYSLPAIIDRADLLTYLMRNRDKAKLIAILTSSPYWSEWIGDKIKSIDGIVHILFESLEKSSLIVTMLD